jgi:hypothetical protein
MMFDPDFDPMSELRALRQDNLQLRNNQMQLAKAFNEQSKTLEQLVVVIKNMQEEIMILHREIELMQLPRPRN